MANLAVHIKAKKGGVSFKYDLHIPVGQITGVYGETGAGKTSLLRFISGLDPIERGVISFDGTEWQSGRHFVAPHKRHIAYVFQKGGLFPHLTVLENLELSAHPQANISDIVAHCRITSLLDQRPTVLSGGQQQQVALARAMAQQSALMLLDEPFSAMDEELRRHMHASLLWYHTAFRPTILLVSHQKSDLIPLVSQVLLIQQQQGQTLLPLTAVFGTNTEMEHGVICQIDTQAHKVWVQWHGQILCLSVTAQQLSQFEEGMTIPLAVTAQIS